MKVHLWLKPELLSEFPCRGIVGPIQFFFFGGECYQVIMRKSGTLTIAGNECEVPRFFHAYDPLYMLIKS